MKYFKITIPGFNIYVEVPENKATNKVVIEQAKKLNLIGESEALTVSSIEEVSKDEFDEVVHIQNHLDKCLR